MFAKKITIFCDLSQIYSTILNYRNLEIYFVLQKQLICEPKVSSTRQSTMLGVSLNNQVGIVTGAGSPYGIGRSMVLALAQAGAKCVYACDLNLSNMPSLEESVKSINSSCEVRGRLLDVSSEAATVNLLREIIKDCGRFDFFFANAGYAFYRYKHFLGITGQMTYFLSCRNLNDLESSHFAQATAVMQNSVFLALKLGSQAMMITSPEKKEPSGNFVITGSCSSFLGGTATADLSYGESDVKYRFIVFCQC